MKKALYFLITLILFSLILFFNCQQAGSSSGGGGGGGRGDGSGNPSWTKLMGVTGRDTTAYGITVDSSGNIYTTGLTTGALDGQPYTSGGSCYDLFILKYNSSGVKQWTRLLGVLNTNTIAYGITTDSDGNVYATGTTSGSLDGQTHTSGSGHTDLFIVKYDSSGVKQWTRLLGVLDVDTTAYGIAVDPDGGVYATGWTYGALDGQPHTAGNGHNDLFIVKYDSKGDKQWTRLMGVAGVDTLSFGIKCFKQPITNNIYAYITGYTHGNLDGVPLTGNKDLFIVKYDKDGTKQWTNLLGATGAFTEAHGIAIDSTGNIYAAGETTGNLGGETRIGLADLFIVKYNSAGTLQWTRLLGTSGTIVYSYGISINSLNGDIYTSGWVTGDLDGQTKVGTNDLFVVKHDSTGTKQWTRLLGVAGENTAGRAIAVDSTSGNSYAAGETTGNLDGKTKTGDVDLFIVKYNSSGVKQ